MILFIAVKLNVMGITTGSFLLTVTQDLIIIPSKNHFLIVTATSLDCHAATKLEVELLISTLFDRRFILVNILEKLILGTNLNFIKYLP